MKGATMGLKKAAQIRAGLIAKKNTIEAGHHAASVKKAAEAGAKGGDNLAQLSKDKFEKN